MNKHYTQQDFLNRIYGIDVDPAMELHLAECRECGKQWEALAAVRERVLRESPAVSPEYMAEQRQRIYGRVEQSRGGSFFARWSPALAVAGMALFVVLWKMPNGRPALPSEVATSADAQLMTDIYKTVYDSEPDVVEPLHGLFESKQ